MKLKFLLILLSAVALHGTAEAQSRQAQQRRTHIERTTREVLAERGRTMVVTSRHRDNSPAHRRGAIDIRSNDIPRRQRHDEARAVSQRLRNHNVVVEDVRGSRQTNTTYRNGQRAAVRDGQRRATGTHTHIQPDATRRSGGRGAMRAD